MIKGYYNDCIIKDNIVIKRINFYSELEKKIFYTSIGSSFVDSTLYYNNEIRKARINTHQILDIGIDQSYYIVQEKIDGVILEEKILIDNENFLSNLNYDKEDNIYNSLFYFLELLNIKKNLLKSNSDIIIDFNKNNFILKDEIIYLVDITPPLKKSSLKLMETKDFPFKQKSLISSYLYLELQLLSMIYYWFKTLIKSLKLSLYKNDYILIYKMMLIFISKVYSNKTSEEINNFVLNKQSFYGYNLHNLLF